MPPGRNKVENTSNPWSDKGKFRVGGVSVMVDNFAIPAATIRGLFDYDYRSDRLIIRPRIPGSITQYTQYEPVRFGEKKLFLSCNNGGSKISLVKVNGKELKFETADEIALFYDELPAEAQVEITTEGGWVTEPSTSVYPEKPALVAEHLVSSEMPESLKKPYSILISMKKQLVNNPGCEYELAYLEDAILSCDNCRIRQTLETGPGYFRPITTERKQGINQFYEQAAMTMYKGFENRMEKYAASTDSRQQQIASIFNGIQK